MYSAPDGFISNSSKSTTFGFTPNNTLNNMRKDSAVPFEPYNDLDSLIKLLTSIWGTNLVSSKPGVSDDLTFL